MQVVVHVLHCVRLLLSSTCSVVRIEALRTELDDLHSAPLVAATLEGYRWFWSSIKEFIPPTQKLCVNIVPIGAKHLIQHRSFGAAVELLDWSGDLYWLQKHRVHQLRAGFTPSTDQHVIAWNKNPSSDTVLVVLLVVAIW